VTPLRFVGFVPAHLPEVTDLWVEAWSRAMPAIDFEARRGWFVDHIAALRSRGTTIICGFRECDGKLAGFFTLERETGYVDQLAISHEMWGQGAGHALLGEAKSLSSGKLFLDVNQDNLRAVRFYEREGFVRAGAGQNATSGLATWRYAWHRDCVPAREG
jgi:putative acetyltransferase